jgi:hypothetical protein
MALAHSMHDTVDEAVEADDGEFFTQSGSVAR